MSGIPKNPPMGSIQSFNDTEMVAREEAEMKRAGNAALAKEASPMGVPAEGPPRGLEMPERYEPRWPVVPADLAERITALTVNIYDTGIRVDQAVILAKGKELFTDLLEADCAERQTLGFIDLTQFAEVEHVLRERGALQPPSALVQSPREQVRGLAGEKAAALRIESFADLWRFDKHRIVRNVLAFHNSLTRLIFGRSLLRADEASRIRSKFWVSGLESKLLAGSNLTALFDFWRSSFIPEQNSSFIVVSLERPLWSLVAWLTDDAELASVARDPNFTSELAREFYDQRSVDPDQIEVVEAVVESYLRGLDFNPFVGQRDQPQALSALGAWQFVGGKLQRSIDPWLLASWRKRLIERFPRIHEWLRSFVAESMQKSYTQSDWGSEASLPALQFSFDLFRERVREAIDARLVTIHRLAMLATTNAISEKDKLVGVLPGKLIVESPARGVVRDQLIQKLHREMAQTFANAFEPDIFSFTIATGETL